MNDFSELENQLRKLRPLQPSADLVTRVERALADERSILLRQGSGGQASTAGVLPRESHFHFNWLSLGLGLAAAAALILLAFVRLQQPAKETPNLVSTSPAPAISNDQLVPAGLTQVVYHTRDEGLHFPTNSNEPVRRVRSQTRETLRWRNPKTGASLRVSYPREEVSLVPISGQ
jgi:negative regulator of sigma E activity